MSPQEREVLNRIVTWATRRWKFPISPLETESIVSQRHPWPLLPDAVRRRMEAAAKRHRGVRLSVDEAQDVRVRQLHAMRRAAERRAAEEAS